MTQLLSSKIRGRHVQAIILPPGSNLIDGCDFGTLTPTIASNFDSKMHQLLVRKSISFAPDGLGRVSEPVSIHYPGPFDPG